MTFVYKICIWQGGEGIQQLTNGHQVPMEARESVIFLPKIKEISWKHGKRPKAEFFRFQAGFAIVLHHSGPSNRLKKPVCQLLNAFFTLPDIYFVHKSHQLAELPSRESKFDQISPTKKPHNYVCQFSNGFVLYRPVSLWYPDIELNV